MTKLPKKIRMQKFHKDYINDLTCGIIEYIETHTDQNIASPMTTLYNLLPHLIAIFVTGAGFSEKEKQIILEDLIKMTISKIAQFEEILKKEKK